ncbi:3-oxoacyl-ACP reductase FabG [bacterium]|nr:3-oxoacyl-ACP reductase FabG [bacterium]
MSQLRFDFSTRTAVITGGAQGIGFQIAKSFLDAGARVSIWDYSPGALDVCRSELSSYGDRVHYAAVDVSKFDACQVASAQLPFKVDVLVNNAGITKDKTLAKMSVEDFEAVIGVNLTGLFNVTRSLLEKFNDGTETQPKQRRIINISSIVGLYGNFGQTNYAAAKSGVIGMTKTWARELGRKGFTVNAIAPGFIQTAMTAKMPKEVLDEMLSKIQVGRLGNPEEIASTCLFLSSQQAAFINGAVISVDGGMLC